MAELLIDLPVETPALRYGSWVAIPADDPVVTFIAQELWDQTSEPISWQVARLSQAVYVYRETNTEWKIVAKFYSAKTGPDAQKYAQRELDFITQAKEAGLTAQGLRALHPMALWNGILFLEHIKGLTLEDLIAIRRSRPGSILPNVGKVAELLAVLHTQEVSGPVEVEFANLVQYGHKLIKNLTNHGVLQGDPIVQAGLSRQLKRWADNPTMENYQSALIHGDATTTNFIFPDEEPGVVAIDWERAKITDPASDLGRLLAEVSHSVNQHGGDFTEALTLLEHITEIYTQSLPPGYDQQAILERARFHQAISALRIARNGWLSRLTRTGLVAHSMALLS